MAAEKDFKRGISFTLVLLSDAGRRGVLLSVFQEVLRAERAEFNRHPLVPDDGVRDRGRSSLFPPTLALTSGESSKMIVW